MIVERKLIARGESATSDVRAFPPWLDVALYGATEVERKLRIRYPAGGSVLVVARTP
jgi:hypothetical protein